MPGGELVDVKPVFVDLSKDNEPGALPKATDPATREGLFWVMNRALLEAYNVAQILSLDVIAQDLEMMRVQGEAIREAEQQSTGTEKLR